MRSQCFSLSLNKIKSSIELEMCKHLVFWGGRTFEISWKWTGMWKGELFRMLSSSSLSASLHHCMSGWNVALGWFSPGDGGSEWCSIWEGEESVPLNHSWQEEDTSLKQDETETCTLFLDVEPVQLRMSFLFKGLRLVLMSGLKSSDVFKVAKWSTQICWC